MEYGPGISATFLYYFTSTAIVFAFITAQSLGTGISGFPQQVGLVGGIVGGLIGVYFNRTVTLSVSKQAGVKAESQKSGKKKSGKAIAKTLPQLIEAMGYELVVEPATEEDAEANDKTEADDKPETNNQTDEFDVYQRKGFSKFFSGKIFVYQENGETVVSSRATHIRALKRLL